MPVAICPSPPVLFPKIVYGSPPVTLNFNYPPRHVPAHHRLAVRHFNIASSGLHESIFERVDTWLTFTMEWVTRTSGGTDDEAAWDAFMAWALQGLNFQYYPDSTQPAFDTYTLAPDYNSYISKHKSVGRVTFDVRIRKVATCP